MQNELKIDKKCEDGICTITLRGQLTTTTAPKLGAVLEEGYDGFAELIFEIADLEYLTSAGLRVLLLARQQTEDLNIPMKLRNVPEEIMQVFTATGFADILTIE